MPTGVPWPRRACEPLRTRSNRWGARLCLMGLACLAGCSVQMAYNNLDRLARWSVSDYIDMSRDQRNYFDARFELLWWWHRRNHLPRYADFLQTASTQLSDRTSEAEMQALVDQVFGWAAEIEARALPMAAELLASLSEDQVDELIEALEEGNREVAEPERGASLEQAQAQWREEFASRFEELSGRLTPVQKAYLEERASSYRPELVQWADYRRRWQQDFLMLLALRDHPEALERGLRQLTALRHLYYGADLAEVYDHNNRLAREMSVWLVNSLTDRQRARFEDRLQDLADDFRELASQSRQAPGGEPLPCLVRC